MRTVVRRVNRNRLYWIMKLPCSIKYADSNFTSNSGLIKFVSSIGLCRSMGSTYLFATSSRLMGRECGDDIGAMSGVSNTSSDISIDF